MSEGSEKELRLFRRQYLQHLDIKQLSWPSQEHLRKSDVQEWIYENCFEENESYVLPPERYRLRVLKPLIAQIEQAITEPDEDEISDNLMSILPVLMFAPLPDETTAAQQKNWVTYTLVPHISAPLSSEPMVKLLENRSVISGAGTTGLRTWEAALHLGSYLISPEGSSLVVGRRVLELGAGTGLLSFMCAGHLEAKQVISTDGDEGVVEALKENASCNRLDAETTFRQLWWGRALKGSWIEEEFAPHACDLVVGADVTYDKAVIPALVSTIRDVFEIWPNVKVMISATIRNEDTFAAFEHACKQNGFGIDEVDHPLNPMAEQVSLFHSDAVPIKIMFIRAPKHFRDPYAV